MDAKQSVQIKHYAQIAGEYDQRYQRENSNHLYKISEIARVLFANLSTRTEGAEILEVGAGSGIHAFHFLSANRARVKSYTVSDISADMLEQAKQRLQPFAVDYLVSPAESLRTERKFDAIFVSGAMHHFSSARASVREMRAHLRPGGVVVVCEPIVWNPVNFLKAASARLEWGQFIATRRNVRGYLAEAGLQIAHDRVLHWKGPSKLAQSLWPYDKLEKIPALAPLAVMFLLAGKLP